FDRYYILAQALLTAGLVWPALEHCLKCSHIFNVLDSSNSIGVTERTAYILRVRQLAVGIANAYVQETAPQPAVAAVGEGGARRAEAEGEGGARRAGAEGEGGMP